MKKLIAILMVAFGAAARGVRSFANEATEDFICVANELKRDGDWIMLAPYGDFKNVRGMQRLTREDAQDMCNEFKSVLNLPARALGLPVFKGHPDHEHFKERDRDLAAYGRVKGLEARPDGLFANVKWSEDGRKLIDGEMFSHPSVNWSMVKRQDGSWKPVRINSVGLTNNPQIPVPAITMANEENFNMDRKKLAKRLSLAEDATDEQIDAAIGQRETDLANEKTARQTAETQRQTAETNFANEKTARTTAETQLKAARIKAGNVLIAAAITAGKVTQAEKLQWETDFANASDFESVVTKLDGLKAKLHREAKSGGLGTRSAKEGERSLQVQDFVNERMKEHGEDYLTAYKAVKGAKPELFQDATT